MRAGLIERGVPASAIYRDPTGYRTWDSVLRARDVYGQKRLLIVSQRFHVDRALFLARHEGIDAWGFDARDVDSPYSILTELRRYPSALRAYFDVWSASAERRRRESTAGKHRSLIGVRPCRNSRHVAQLGHRRDDRLAGEMVVEVLAHQRGHAALGMLGAAAEMRRHHQVVERQQFRGPRTAPRRRRRAPRPRSRCCATPRPAPPRRPPSRG